MSFVGRIGNVKKTVVPTGNYGTGPVTYNPVSTLPIQVRSTGVQEAGPTPTVDASHPSVGAVNSLMAPSSVPLPSGGSFTPAVVARDYSPGVPSVADQKTDANASQLIGIGFLGLVGFYIYKGWKK